MEEGNVDEIFYSPKHPYTLGLLKSIPKMADKDQKQRLIPIPGTPPDLLHPPKGCPFAQRCPFAMKICINQMPEYTNLNETHRSMCWLLHKDAPLVDDINSNLKGVLVNV